MTSLINQSWVDISLTTIEEVVLIINAGLVGDIFMSIKSMPNYDKDPNLQFAYTMSLAAFIINLLGAIIIIITLSLLAVYAPLYVQVAFWISAVLALLGGILSAVAASRLICNASAGNTNAYKYNIIGASLGIGVTGVLVIAYVFYMGAERNKMRKLLTTTSFASALGANEGKKEL